MLCSFRVPHQGKGIKRRSVLRRTLVCLYFCIEDAKDTASYWGSSRSAGVLKVTPSGRGGALRSEDIRLAAFKSSIRTLPRRERLERLRRYYLEREVLSLIGRHEAELACQQEEQNLASLEAELEQILQRRSEQEKAQAEREMFGHFLNFEADFEVDLISNFISRDVRKMLMTPEERLEEMLVEYPEEYHQSVRNAFARHPDALMLALDGKHQLNIAIAEDGEAHFGHIEVIAPATLRQQAEDMTAPIPALSITLLAH